MIRGIYSAAAGLATVALRLGVASNNVANANTPGYKQDRLPQEVGRALDLERLVREGKNGEVGALTLGPKSGLSDLDLAQGPLQETGNPLDLALGGRGFFSVRNAAGQTRYTRDGGFNVDALGALRSRDGSQVLGDNGQPIQIGPGSVSVGADGSLFVDGVAGPKLQIVDFAANVALTKEGKGLFVPEGEVAGTPVPDAQIYQGYVEGSNVDMTESMVSVMELVRAYAANQRMVQVQDETLSRAVNDVGKL